MKTQQTKDMIRSAALALCAVGLALSGPISSQAAEQASNPTTGTYGSGKNYKTSVERQSEGELSAEDLHQASLLSSQLLMHLNAAAQHCIDGKGDSAKPEIEKAQSLAGIVRKLLPTTTVTTLGISACGWPAAASKVASAWARPRTFLKHRRGTRAFERTQRDDPAPHG